MRLSRTDLVPVLAIVAGGVIGATLSISFLGQSPSADVRTIVPIVATYESIEVLRLEEAKANAITVYTFEQIEALRRESLRREAFEQVERILRSRINEFDVEEPNRVEPIEEILESVRDRVEELQRVLERIQEGSAIEFRGFTIDSDVTIRPNTVQYWTVNESGVAASRYHLLTSNGRRQSGLIRDRLGR